MSQLIVVGAVCCPSCFTNQSCEFLVPEIESETTFGVFPWILNSRKIMPLIARGRPSSETQGQIVGTRKSLNGRKNIGHEEK